MIGRVRADFSFSRMVKMMRRRCSYKKLAAWFFFAATIYLLAGCGYRFMGSGVLPENFQKVAVAVFENRSAETGAEQFFTNDLIYELARNGHTVPRPEDADAVIYGTIESITIDTVSRRALVASTERRITVNADIRLVGPDGAVVWAATGISDDETYGVMPQKVATEYGKRRAIETISRRIAEEAYRRMTMEGEFPVGEPSNSVKLD